MGLIYNMPLWAQYHNIHTLLGPVQSIAAPETTTLTTHETRDFRDPQHIDLYGQQFYTNSTLANFEG